MICPQCGALVQDELKKCDNCNWEFNMAEDTDKTLPGGEIVPTLPAIKDENTQSGKHFKKERPDMYKVLMLILAIVIVILSFYGANYISEGGLRLNSMKTTVSLFSFDTGNNASYYQNLGAVFYGFAYGIRAIGVGLASLVLAISFKKN